MWEMGNLTLILSPNCLWYLWYLKDTQRLSNFYFRLNSQKATYLNHEYWAPTKMSSLNYLIIRGYRSWGGISEMTKGSMFCPIYRVPTGGKNVSVLLLGILRSHTSTQQIPAKNKNTNKKTKNKKKTTKTKTSLGLHSFPLYIQLGF